MDGKGRGVTAFISGDGLLHTYPRIFFHGQFFLSRMGWDGMGQAKAFNEFTFDEFIHFIALDNDTS